MDRLKNLSYTVDIVIPVRIRDDYDIIERLEWKQNSSLPKNFNIIVVDHGSGSSKSQELKSVCSKLKYKYHYVDKENYLFNISEARNVGLLNSTADYVIFEDVDLIHPEDFYEKINIEIKNLIINQGWRFFVVPVTYLSEKANVLLDDGITNIVGSRLISEVFNPESEYIQHHAPTSSFVVCKRADAILVGGFDESYEGWGFEDSDFAIKLLLLSNIDKPRRFFRLDTRPYYKQVSWDGWRSVYRLFGDLLAFKGIYSFHVWHSIAEHRNKSIKERNRNIFLDSCSRYAKNNFTFTPLVDRNKPTHLFISKNPHSWNYDLFDFFDNSIFIDENHIDINVGVKNIIEEYKVESVVFNNPYSSVKRKLIYDAFKSLNVKCYVVERGALPGSIYIDINGFCACSSSYNEEHWIHNSLSAEDHIITRNYIENIKTTGITLEPQSPMIGADNLKKKLFGDGQDIKIMFVALQSPSDTTTNYFCGQIGSYNNYLNEIEKLPHLLPSNWKVVVKNHPLSIEKFYCDDVVIVDDYHINDIFGMCDCVSLLNSGMGVLSMLWEKYTFIFGHAFYSFDNLNQNVIKAEEVALAIKNNTCFFDRNKSNKFINYLISSFYSFATWERGERKHTEKANLSISKNIKYKNIRIIGEYEKNIPDEKKIQLLESYLFDRYRMDEYVYRKSKKEQPENEINKKSIARRRYEKFKESPLSYLRTIMIKAPKKMKKLLN